MTPEDQFLRAATRGLSRRKRAEAQAELRSHLHERTQQLILVGKPQPSAQAQAMKELGTPGQIARGLRRTDTLPAGVAVLAWSLLTVTSCLTITAVGYTHSFPTVTRAVDQVLFPVTAPCEEDTRCFVLPDNSQARLRRGIMTWNEARVYLKGSGLKVSRWPRQQISLPGFPTVAGKALNVEVQNQANLQRQGGYLDLAAVLVQGAEQGWPVTLAGKANHLQVMVNGHPLSRGEVLGKAVIEASLRHMLSSTVGKKLARSAQVLPGDPPLSTFAFIADQPLSTKSGLTLSTPVKDTLYALISFRPRSIKGNEVFLPYLSAQIRPAVNRQTHYWMQGKTVTLVPDVSRFLQQAQRGQPAALLMALPHTGDPVPLKAQRWLPVPLSKQILAITQ